MDAIAYLRRSRVDTRRPGAMSHEQQLAAVRRLAEQHGDDPDALVVIEDWGKSGRAEKQHLRGGFARLEKLVKDGQVSTIYSYSASRLSRSLESLARLAKLCEAAGVPIRCADGYSPDVSTSTGRMVLGILGSIHQWQAEWTGERAQEVTSMRRIRGDYMGPAPYGFRVRDGQLAANPDEDVAQVIAAFKQTGSYQAAARLLTTQRLKTRRGQPWAASTVRYMLRRVAPEVIPATMTRGRRSEGREFRLRGLLRCPCGATLTGRRFRGEQVAYECKRSRESPEHGRPAWVSERKLLPWIMAQAARFRVPVGKIPVGEQDGRREELEAQRRRVFDNYEAGGYGDGPVAKRTRDTKLAVIADELAQSVSLRALATIPKGIDWSWPAADVNTILHTYWSDVELDDQLRPVRANWLLPPEYVA